MMISINFSHPGWIGFLICFSKLCKKETVCKQAKWPVVTHLFRTSNFICSQAHPPLLFSGLGPLFLMFILLISRPIMLNLTRGAWRLQVAHQAGANLPYDYKKLGNISAPHWIGILLVHCRVTPGAINLLAGPCAAPGWRERHCDSSV